MNIKVLWQKFDDLIPSFKMKVILITFLIVAFSIFGLLLIPLSLLTLFVLFIGSWLWDQIQSKF